VANRVQHFDRLSRGRIEEGLKNTKAQTNARKRCGMKHLHGKDERRRIRAKQKARDNRVRRNASQEGGRSPSPTIADVTAYFSHKEKPILSRHGEKQKTDA